MNSKFYKRILIYSVPTFTLLILYVVLMSIMGENAKISNKSKNFINSFLGNDYPTAFNMLTKKYQSEFFDQPLIFKYSLLSMKDSVFFTVNNEIDQSEDNKDISEELLDNVIDLNPKEKKFCFVERKFPFLPWSRGETIETTFAVSENMSDQKKMFGQIENFLEQLFNHYSKEIISQFEENKIVLVQEKGEWKISNLIANNVRIGNIFQNENYQIGTNELIDTGLKLEELEEIAKQLEKNKISPKNLNAFYEIIIKKGQIILDYLKAVENKRVRAENES
jgi:hypothetical protein